MRITYNEIQPLEKTVLQDQYEASPFYKNGKHKTTQPIHLEIFDFDSTLFLSPSLSPTLWHPTLLKELVGEDVYGPGWWRDIRSLELGPIDKLEKEKWEGYWNEDIVEKARISLADPTIMTVLLTGRRTVPFHSLISRMVASKGLDFDLLGLRPDPTQKDHDLHIQLTSSSESSLSFLEEEKGKKHKKKHYHHHSKRKETCIVYGANSIFKDTMDFKTSFILNILHNVPTIQNITMWDDRLPHVKKFQTYLQELIHLKTITESKVNYVPGIRPKYHPQWESQVVQHIFTSHDANEILFREQQSWNAHIQPLTWDHYIEHHEKEEKEEKEESLQQHLNHHFYLTSSPSPSSLLSSSFQYIPLATLPSNTIIQLSEETKKALKKRFEPYYYEQLKKNKKVIQGWKSKAEIPLWFGDQIILSLNVLTTQQLRKYGGLHKKVQFFIKSISDPHPQLGLMALIRLKPTDDTLKNESAPPSELIRPTMDYMLPLIYKPSMATSLHYKHYHWNYLPNNNQFFGHGEIAYNSLIGLGATIDKPILPLKRISRNSNGETSFLNEQVSDPSSSSASFIKKNHSHKKQKV